MLVICALALVVAAAVFLVMGLAGGDIGDLYLSMVLCVSSLVVVAVSARLSRIRPAPAAAEPPEPVAPVEAEASAPSTSVAEPVPDLEAADSAPEPVDRLAKVPAGVGAGAGEGSIWGPAAAAPAEPRPVAEVDAGPQEEVQPEPHVEPEGTGAPAAPADDGAPFPIADYDALAVEQLLPLVPRLWPEEIPVVAARERSTRARPTVLDALADAAADPSLAFPIAEYESLGTEQVTRLLTRLDPADLAIVQAAERSGAARVGVLVAVADQIASRAPRSGDGGQSGP